MAQEPSEEWVATRLAQLRDELATGEAMMADLTQQIAGLRETTLRIRGAIQVLEEFGTDRS